ncbi:aldo/keto reductase [Microbispora catharanthi]|uniref:Aldo/keto reductase n=1 Tax=Microbispora catharanthi TaxID=1712871 RepID=A0A5N6C576_9ACTN|nr:aldo/keto reductase [Microbispora catharanthi]KAB8187849.1 aldo/keto reductase [Microbispora catharanthi]
MRKWVQEMGLGLAAIGRPAYITLGRDEDLGGDRDVAAMRARTWEVLDAARAAGVRYYDVARSYGLAEEFLAGWLANRGIRPGEVEVGSKWGYEYVGGWRMDADRHEEKDLSAARLRRQLGETRELLGEHLSLYQIHSATVESGVLDDEEVLGALRALRAEGVAVGLSTTGPRQAATIDRAVATGIFDTVQSTWNLLERSAGEALARAHAAGLSVIVKEGVANGRLTARGAPPALALAARERGVTPDALALAAVLARPWAGVVLSGAATTTQLAENLAALAVTWDDATEEALADLAEDAETYWARRAALPWT